MRIEKRVIDPKKILRLVLVLALVVLFGVLTWLAVNIVTNIIENERVEQERIESIPEGNMITITSTRVPATPIPTPEPIRPVFTVAFEASASHLPVIHVAEFEHEEYQLSLLPLDFNRENWYSAEDLARMLETGEVDVLFTGSQFLPRFGNIGVVIFPVSQSMGADQIVSWTESITQSTTIAVVENSRGHFLTLLSLRLNNKAVDSIEFVYTTTEDEAVQQFLLKKVDAVAGRGPIERAILVGGTEIASSSDYPIYDVAIASNDALVNKGSAIQQFVEDWYRSMRTLQEEPEVVATSIAYWRYEQQPTNGWSRVYRDTAVDDLQQALSLYSQAGLEDSIIMQGPEILSDYLLDSYAIWIWSGIELPEFNALEAIAPSFVISATENTNLWPEDGELMNDTFRMEPIN